MARLTIKKDDELIAEFPIEARATRIGRDEGNDIVLPGKEVSRFHSRVIKTDSGYLIEDLGSARGTYVNDDEISQTYLSDGDIVFLGEYTLYFHLSKAEQEAIAALAKAHTEEVSTEPFPEQAAKVPPEPTGAPAEEVSPEPIKAPFSEKEPVLVTEAEPIEALPVEEGLISTPEAEPPETIPIQEKQALIPKETKVSETSYPKEEPTPAPKVEPIKAPPLEKKPDAAAETVISSETPQTPKEEATVSSQINSKLETRDSKLYEVTGPPAKGIPWARIILIILLLSGGLWAAYLLLPEPTPPEVLLAQGVALAKQGEYERAISRWEIIPKNQPEHKIALKYIKRAEERLAAVKPQEKTKVELAKLEETQAADTGGRALEMGGEQEVRPSPETIKAEKVEVKPEAPPAEKAVDRKKQREEALVSYQEGVKALETGDLEGAASLFRKAVALNPSLERAQGKLKAVEYRLSEARRHMDQALEAEKKKDWAEALTEWNRVADLIRDPIHPIYKAAVDGQVEAKRGLAVSHLSRGRELVKEGNATQAIKEFEQVITLQPETKLADNAREELTRAQERLSRLLKPRYDQAVEYYEQRRLPEALSEFQEIIRIQSNYRDVSAMVSKIKLALVERAKGLYVEGLQLRGQDQEEEAKKKWQEILWLLAPMPDNEYYQKAKKRLQE